MSTDPFLAGFVSSWKSEPQVSFKVQPPYRPPVFPPDPGTVYVWTQSGSQVYSAADAAVQVPEAYANE
jgi:hypothetical protein